MKAFNPIPLFAPLAIMIPILLIGCSKSETGAGMQFPPTEVVVHVMQAGDVVLTSALPGRTSAYRYAEVRPQVSGIVVKRLFEEGAEVKAGDSLYQIDDKPFQTDLAMRAAENIRAESALKLAQSSYDRLQNLLGSNSVSHQAVDDAEDTLNQARADFESAKAELQRARIDLEYTQVKAPISGRIGRSSVTEGALVTAEQNQALALINQLNPIYVDIAKTADQIIALRMKFQSGELQELHPAKVRLLLDAGLEYPHVGQLEFSEVSVSESTGMVVLRALFPNPEGMLLPGMFVHTEVEEGVRPNALLLPQQALMRDRTGGAMVYLVNAENQIEARPVTADQALGDQWLISQGLAAGDRVVIEGLQKVGPGAPVTPILAQSSGN